MDPGDPVIILAFIGAAVDPVLAPAEVLAGRARQLRDLTVKAESSHQWNWSYEYPDQGDLVVELSEMLDPTTEAKDQPVEPRLLAVDKEGGRVVVPVNKVRMRVIVTSTDVIHSWARCRRSA